MWKIIHLPNAGIQTHTLKAILMSLLPRTLDQGFNTFLCFYLEYEPKKKCLCPTYPNGLNEDSVSFSLVLKAIPT